MLIYHWNWWNVMVFHRGGELFTLEYTFESTVTMSVFAESRVDSTVTIFVFVENRVDSTIKKSCCLGSNIQSIPY